MFKCPECGEMLESLQCEKGSMTCFHLFDGEDYEYESCEDAWDATKHADPIAFTCPECWAEIGDSEDEAMKHWVKEKTEDEKHAEEYAGWQSEQDEIVAAIEGR